MGKLTGVSKYFAFRQRLIEEKEFLVCLAYTKTEKSREKLLKGATTNHLILLRDLVINIAEKNIEIGKEIFHQLQKRKKVSDLAKLISRIKRSPGVSDKKLRLLLLKFNPIIPYIIKSILK